MAQRTQRSIRGRRTSWRTVSTATAVAAVLMTLTLASPAAGSLVPVEYGPAGDFNHISCPSSTQCTATEDASTGQASQEVTFNPQSPNQSDPVPIDAAALADAPSCPTITQCTVIDQSGNVVTFNPQAPGQPTPESIFPGPQDTLSIDGLSCPSATLCVAFRRGQGDVGQEATFNPQAPGSSDVYSLDGGLGLFDIACPAISQCTGVGYMGHETTFDPRSPGNAATVTIASGRFLDEVQCLSVSQCIAAASDSIGGFVADEVSFDPASPNGAVSVALDATGIGGLVCPTTTLCLGVRQILTGGSFHQAQVVGFGPAGGAPSLLVSSSAPGPTMFGALACPAAALCVTVSTGRATVFNPTVAGSAATATIEAATAVAARLVTLACPSTTQCTALDAAGYESPSGFHGAEVTYDPGSPRPTFAVPLPIITNSVEGGQATQQIACPSTSQCTAVGDDGQEVTFNPHSPGNPTAFAVTRRLPYSGMIACPSVTQCTVVSANRAVTFNPRAPLHRSPIRLAGGVDTLDGELACPAARQCSVIVGDGRLETFDPRTRRQLHGLVVDPLATKLRSAVYVGGGKELSCPTTSRCIVLAVYHQTRCTSVSEIYSWRLPGFPPCARGRSATLALEFDLNPVKASAAIGRQYAGATGPVTCPSARRCVAVLPIAGGFALNESRALSWDPAQPGRSHAVTVLPRHHALGWLSCPGKFECATVDGPDELIFNPR